jgi:hypothetical protein
MVDPCRRRRHARPVEPTRAAGTPRQRPKGAADSSGLGPRGDLLLDVELAIGIAADDGRVETSPPPAADISGTPRGHGRPLPSRRTSGRCGGSRSGPASGAGHQSTPSRSADRTAGVAILDGTVLGVKLEDRLGRAGSRQALGRLPPRSRGSSRVPASMWAAAATGQPAPSGVLAIGQGPRPASGPTSGTSSPVAGSNGSRTVPSHPSSSRPPSPAVDGPVSNRVIAGRDRGVLQNRSNEPSYRWRSSRALRELGW